jgi:hypothetical protein
LKPDGTKSYSEANLTRIFTTKSVCPIPTKPTTSFPLQFSAPTVSADSFSNIPASYMKHIGIGFGGLKGYAYVKSLEEFTTEVLSGKESENLELKELVRIKADKVTKGVFTLENAIRTLDRAPLFNVDKLIIEDIPELDNLENHSEDIIYENNDMIINYLSKRRTGRMREAYNLEEQSLLQRLHNQIAFLCTKNNNQQILNKLAR